MKKPTMTLKDVRSAIEAQDRQLAEAHESVRASGVRILPVTSKRLRQLAEACDVTAPAVAPASALPQWSALRC